MAKELTWNGTLSPNEFQEAAKAFVEKWKGCISLPEGGYLSLESVYKQVAEEICPNMDGYSLECSTVAEVADDATLVWACDKEAHVYDFHIIYSTSYRVPVLYFRGYNIDGKPLDWNVIKEDLPLSSIKMLDESRWTFITQEEHPYLKRPWFTLHPCGTSDWMKLLFLDKIASKERAACIPNYVLSWFSMVGQAVGLKVPLHLLNVDKY